MVRANRKYIYIPIYIFFFFYVFPVTETKSSVSGLFVCTGFDKEKVNPAHYKQATHARFLLSERITVI